MDNTATPKSNFFDFGFDHNRFSMNGKGKFLNSGEIHYFRIKRELWDIHLEAACDAGLNAVSTYVPWAWHEPSQGVFDFEGTTLAERDLKGWLTLCQKYGLACIVKPGPFILAEFRGAGLPDWLLNKHGEQIAMRNSRGEIVPSEGVSLFHPVFIEKVSLWYDHVMPLIGKFQQSKGGPVIMMQVCNEIGVFSWLAHQADYSPEVRVRFGKFIQKEYGTIERLNSCWGTKYHNFTALELPPDGMAPYLNAGDRCRDYLWHLFWRSYYADYLQLLSQRIRQHGVMVPLYHNLPGWIYGSAYEFPVNITMYEQLYGAKSEILFGIDHIPEFQSHRNMHDDRIVNDITKAMQGAKPLFAAEFQSGSREYHVVPSVREMELFYKASIANGLVGWNYYMFSQGRNPSQKGYSGDTFYWFTPLTAEGLRTPAFHLVKRMSSLIGSLENTILASQRIAEVCVLFYPPFYTTELERPELGASGVQHVPSHIRRPAYFDGLLRVLQVLNVEYDMASLPHVGSDYLRKYRQVWLFSTDEMDAPDQQKIIDYTKAGGHAVVFPFLPSREMNQQSCSIIRDALSIEPLCMEEINSPLIDILGLKDIKCSNPVATYASSKLEPSSIVATTLTGKPCGFVQPLGKGKLLHLGAWLGFDTEGHKAAYMAILELMGGNLYQARSSSDFITTRQRFTPNGQSMLFVANYHNDNRSGKVWYRHPKTNETLTIPFSENETTWPSIYALLTPINMPICNGVAILHTTSDVLNIRTDKQYVELTLMGHRDLMGEMVIECSPETVVGSCTIEGVASEPIRENGRVVLNYQHKNGLEIVLKLILE